MKGIREGDALLLPLLGLQSRFGDNCGHVTWNLSGMSPKREWSSKRVITSADEDLYAGA